ncbi:unnamed protein product [Peronospora destructor]|uniref:Transcriptional adapter 2-alpha n=1 Tax=Peronospora destructor TaxID=86335 RepID=A0AAV0UEC3_9STRA|nr:unnamed protein product [Peronospora destructor]
MAGKGDTTRRSHTRKSKNKGRKESSTTSTELVEFKSPIKPTNDAPPLAKPAALKTKFCLNCHKNLARNIRVTCAECNVQPLFELCVECFAVGIELGEHKKSHKYMVSDCLAFPIVYEPQPLESTCPSPGAIGTNAAAFFAASNDAANAVWTADEELLLLEGIEMFGMGNWKDIAEHVVTKSDKSCEQHYLTAYLGWKDLMPRFIGDTIDESNEKQTEDKVHMTEEKTAGNVYDVGSMYERTAWRKKWT